MDCINSGLLRVIYGDYTLGIKGRKDGKDFHYIFSYGKGGPESFCIEKKEWLYRVPKPVFWRALTDNDRGNGFHIRSGMWLCADSFINCVAVSVAVNEEEIPFPCAPENNKYSDNETAEKIEIIYTYETITRPAAKVTVSYEVSGNGEILVKTCYFGTKGLPELPVFGLRFVMPACADKFIYQGLSGETYPDRKAGAVPGVYEVEGLPVTPYPVPQECGMHMDTEWVEIYRSKVLDNRAMPQKQTALLFKAEGEKFAFSCLPYTAQELENALHQEELPPARRTVLCICGAVRGVGGINSWGADVEPAYRISGEKDIAFSFRIVIG